MRTGSPWDLLNLDLYPLQDLKSENVQGLISRCRQSHR